MTSPVVKALTLAYYATLLRSISIWFETDQYPLTYVIVKTGYLPWVIEMLCSFENGAQRNEPGDTHTSITSERSPELSQ